MRAKFHVSKISRRVPGLGCLDNRLLHRILVRMIATVNLFTSCRARAPAGTVQQNKLPPTHAATLGRCFNLLP